MHRAHRRRGLQASRSGSAAHQPHQKPDLPHTRSPEGQVQQDLAHGEPFSDIRTYGSPAGMERSRDSRRMQESRRGPSTSGIVRDRTSIHPHGASSLSSPPRTGAFNTSDNASSHKGGYDPDSLSRASPVESTGSRSGAHQNGIRTVASPQKGSTGFEGAASASSSSQSIVIPIPPEDVGRLIGKQGAQVRALREQARCEITVDTTDRQRPCARVKGSASAIGVARQLIASICGGDGVAFIRDVDSATLFHLVGQSWLEKEQARHEVVAELKNRHLRLRSLKGDTKMAQRFKELVEERIQNQSKNTYYTVPLSFITCREQETNILNDLREHLVIAKLLSTFSDSCRLELIYEAPAEDTEGAKRPAIRFEGPKGVVETARDVMDEFVAEAQPHSAPKEEPTTDSSQKIQTLRMVLPVLPALFNNCSPKKRQDFDADLTEGICQRFNVQVHWSVGSPNVTVEGCHPSQVKEAYEELKQLIRYYFNENCAIIPLSSSALPLVWSATDAPRHTKDINPAHPPELFSPASNITGEFYVMVDQITSRRSATTLGHSNDSARKTSAKDPTPVSNNNADGCGITNVLWICGSPGRVQVALQRLAEVLATVDTADAAFSAQPEKDPRKLPRPQSTDATTGLRKSHHLVGQDPHFPASTKEEAMRCDLGLKPDTTHYSHETREPVAY